jgi:protein-L-isoaspartate(D-aspartate) O-methyltransferase
MMGRGEIGWGLICLLAVLAGWTGPDRVRAAEDPWEDKRRAMVAGQIQARGVNDPAVLRAMARVPRHLFVPSPRRSMAYADSPLPIGFGQTISQPFIVAYMTQVLKLSGGEKVLEVGTGSGYQAAVLAETGGRVFSMEVIPQLHERAKETLARTGYGRIRLKLGDGYLGWPEEGPFEAIIVTCAAGHIPPPLVEQLAPGGRMVIPVGPPMFVQDLVLAEKDKAGRVKTRSLMAVRFVPLVRGK